MGISSYVTKIGYSGYPLGDDQLSGFALWVTGALTKNVALRAGWFSLEHEDFSYVDASGIDLQMLVGNNFDEEGFKIYGGIGYFSEEWEGPATTFDFSGTQFTIGIGYNWEQFSLDWWGSARDGREYEELVRDVYGLSVDASAASCALMIAYRF